MVHSTSYLYVILPKKCYSYTFAHCAVLHDTYVKFDMQYIHRRVANSIFPCYAQYAQYIQDYFIHLLPSIRIFTHWPQYSYHSILSLSASLIEHFLDFYEPNRRGNYCPLCRETERILLYSQFTRWNFCATRNAQEQTITTFTAADVVAAAVSR